MNTPIDLIAWGGAAAVVVIIIGGAIAIAITCINAGRAAGKDVTK